MVENYRISKGGKSGKDKGKGIDDSYSVNMMEDGKNKNNNKNSKGKKRKNDDNNDGSDKKSKLTCWKMMHLLGGLNGATFHACKDRCWFDTFHPVQDGSVLHMGDESTKPILGH
ncbi:hypothetical protein Tco_0746232 [Tanacetum coccineum]